MNEKLIKDYAKLIVKVGANVQPGQPVRLCSDVKTADFAEMVVKECYEAGAEYVEMIWTCENVTKLHYTYASAETLGKVFPWEEERAKQMTRDFPVRIFIDSDDPDNLSGISSDKITAVTRMRSSVLKKYRDALDGKEQWLIVAVPSVKWAQKVFPGLGSDEAVEKLWEAILGCVHVREGSDAVAEWEKHVKKMNERSDWLNSQKFVRIEYKSKNGTDFSAELIPGAKWTGAGEINHRNGVFFVPNMPTEEVFTSPMRGKCEGRLVASKPLSYSGQLIENFYVDFKDGKVCASHAEKGGDALAEMFSTDEGSSMLGELALVPKESPINTSGIMFFNTLFDENACCHVAVGEGFGEVLDGFIDMTPEQLKEKGINDSAIHVDFMIGTEDLDITGYRADGSSAPIFKNGTWAI